MRARCDFLLKRFFVPNIKNFLTPTSDLFLINASPFQVHLLKIL